MQDGGYRAGRGLVRFYEDHASVGFVVSIRRTRNDALQDVSRFVYGYGGSFPLKCQFL